MPKKEVFWAIAIQLLLVSIAAGGDVIGPIYQDISNMPEYDRKYMRYLDFSNIPVDKLDKYLKVISGHVNGLSRKTRIQIPVVIAKTMMRLDTRYYGWNLNVWEKFRDNDLYFRIQIQTDWPGGVWEGDGKNYPKGAFKVSGATGSYTAMAPWVAETPEQLKKLAYIQKEIGDKAFVLRADWWFADTAAQEDKVVGYYGLLEIKDQKDFENVARFNVATAAELEHRRVVLNSGIALQRRRVERLATVKGGLWRTFDNKKATGKGNPAVFLDDEFTFDATEQFAPLPNGLPVWFLANNKGVRQDKAPDNIVGGDTTTHSNDTRLQVGISCWRCHSGKGESGIKEVLSAKIRKIFGKDYDQLQEIDRQYMREWQEELSTDRRRFELAIKEATGMSFQEYGEAYGDFYSWYEDAKIDLARAALDLNCTVEQFKAGMESQEKLTGQLHPDLTVILSGTLTMRQWEEVYPLAQATIRGIQP
jgi:hypothetical protein